MIISKLRRLTIVAMGALVLSSAFVPNAAASCFDKKVRSLLKEKIKSGSDLSIQSKGGQCGHGVDIIDQFREQSLDLKFGDKTKKFIPIYLTDKYPDSWRCHRLKVRIGCVLKVEQRSKDAEVTLSSQPGGGWVKDRLIVSDAGKISYRGDVSGQLFLIPARSRFGGAVRIDIRPAISQAAEKFRAEVCDQRPYRKKYGRPTNCRRAVSYFVERQFYEKLRTYLRPTRKPLKVRRADKQEFIAKLGNLTDIKRRIHNSIWKNELGPRVSPYQLSDAVLAASGLSFGVRQWDIGVNSDGQNLFKKIINNSPSSTIAPTLARRSNAGYFFKPIRTMRISEYRFLMRSWEAIQTALDETLSREISVSAHRRYLGDMEDWYRKMVKSEPFRSYPRLAILVIDTANQRGRKTGEGLRKILQSDGSIASLTDGQRVSERHLFRGFGKRHPCDVQRRVRNALNVTSMVSKRGQKLVKAERCKP